MDSLIFLLLTTIYLLGKTGINCAMSVYNYTFLMLHYVEYL